MGLRIRESGILSLKLVFSRTPQKCRMMAVCGVTELLAVILFGLGSEFEGERAGGSELRGLHVTSIIRHW